MSILHWTWAGETSFLGDSAKQIAVGMNADGRLEIFYVGTNNDLYHNWQTAANGSWAGETRFPGNSAKQVAVGRNQDGRLEIFYVGTNDDLYHNWQDVPNGNWVGETRFAKNSAKQVAVASNADGRLEIFYVGTNDDLYHNWQDVPNGGWAGETHFAKNSAKQVAVGRNADGRLEIFYVGTNDDLYHNWQVVPNGTWAGETRFADNSAKQVAVGQNADGRLEIFYVGTNDDLYHNWQVVPNGTWAGETRFPGSSAKQITVGQDADGRIEIFYVGTNNDLYHNWQIAPNGTWAGETRFPDDSAKQVAVGKNEDGRLEIFYVGTNDVLYHNWQTLRSAAWTNLNGVGTVVADPSSGLGSNSNYMMANNCQSLIDVAVTVSVTEDMVVQTNGAPDPGFGSVSGFSWQLNCYAPTGDESLVQQYVMGFDGNQIYGQVNNWHSTSEALINKAWHLANVSQKIPAGYLLEIALHNNDSGSIDGVSFAVVDEKGNLAGSVTKSLLLDCGLDSTQISPIVGFEMDLVGPGNGESVTFSSGAGTIEYLCSTRISVLNSGPSCAETDIITEETSNSVYDSMDPGPSNYFLQPFSTSSRKSIGIRRRGRTGRRLISPVKEIAR